MKLSRRQLIAGGLASLSVWWLTKFTNKLNLYKETIPGELLGASSNLGHQLRVNKFPQPKVIVKKPLVIVGAGISGLAAGYRLHKARFDDFFLLDLEKHPGGNAQSGKNAVSAYPWGAHYVPLLTEESFEVRKLFEELGVITAYSGDGLPVYNEYFLCHDPQERLFRLGRWQDGLIPTVGITSDDEVQYRRFFGFIGELKGKKGGDGKTLFAIPVDASSQDPDWLALDRISMRQWLSDQGYNSKPLLWYIEYCCRDDFGTTLPDTSAWAGLHYFASRSGQAANAASDSVITWPEGNGWLAAALANPIQDRIINNALCFSVSVNESLNKMISSMVRQAHHERNHMLTVRPEPVEGLNQRSLNDSEVMVDYFDTEAKQSVRIQAKAVILATPRFIAGRLLSSNKISINTDHFTYSPWAVANITLSRLPKGKDAPLSWDNVVYGSPFIGYVNNIHQMTQMTPTATVITYYWPLSHLPPAQAREEALKRPYSEWQDLFLEELLRVHPELDGYVERVDIWLWGHGMIWPTPGFIWGHRRPALIQRPPVFTAHSDMSGISIFEEAYTRGADVAEQALSFLNKQANG